MTSQFHQMLRILGRMLPRMSPFGATFLLAGSLSVPMPSLAAAAAQVDVQGGPGQQVIIVLNDPSLLIAETSAVSGDSSASAYGNLKTGVLRDTALATNAYPGTPYAAYAGSSALDTVTFSGGAGQTAYLDWSFHGSLSYVSPLMATYGQMLVFIGSDYANIMLSANRGNCGQGSLFADCTVGTSVSKYGSIPFEIPAGPLQLGAVLQAYSQYGNAAQFGSTGKIYLRTPEGVTFTSSSGQFLSEALPIPEPESYVLMLLGLCAVGLRVRRR